jgi:exopolyphosphatase/pppGpp-phosphohydrolase
VHGTCLDRDRIADVTDMLASISSAERQSSLGIGAGRADILVAGARVLLRTLDSMGRRRLQVSGWGLRHGLAIGAGQAGDPRLDAQLALRLATDEPPTTA